LRNIIAISRYLERHFSGRRRHTIRVTALMDVGQIPFRDRTPNDRVVFLYAGTPGRKDLLREMFVALASLSPDERSRIEFRLIGPTTKELVSLLGKDASLLALLGETVKIVGRIPRERVLDVLQEAHFTVLLRPDKRYAHAGFPSKVAESLAAGTPVFLNFTSDLEEYLGDGTAVMAVHGTAPQDVADAMRRALTLTAEELAQLRRGARRKAEQFFHYALFEDSFDDFLQHLR
jgi:glycosyltransferase involved in cell wall biosynthesis